MTSRIQATLRKILRHGTCDSLTFSTAILGGAFFGWMTMPRVIAQQTPAWSPQTFVKPSTEPTSAGPNTVPQNKLRQSDAPQNGDVHRWGVSNKELRPETAKKSYSEVLSLRIEPQNNAGVRIASAPASSSIRQANSEIVAAAAPVNANPRSGFELAPPAERPVTQSTASQSKPAQGLPKASQVQLASYNESSSKVPEQENRTSGVWIDRNAARDSQPTAAQPARYQEPQLPPFNGQLPPGPPPIKDILDGIPKNTLPQNLLDRRPTNPLNDMPEPVQAQPLVEPKKPGRSLLDQDADSSNPFNREKTPKDGSRSPSDNKEPPPIRSKDDSDAAPAPPRRVDRSVVDCDSIRLLAKESDITKIRVDSSPNFVEGYKSKDPASTTTKGGFMRSAAVRPWLSYDGQLVAEGRMVDLKLGCVVIERSDGTQISYLLHKLSDADQVYVGEKWGLPVTCSIDDRSFPRRDFVETTVTWKASGACHKPLYFEDVQLERYGHEWGPIVQPVISTAHFFGDVVVLPYKMGIHPMNECQYSLGYYRPGNCAPWTIGPVPISLRGALMQAKVLTGAGLALP